MLPVIALVGRPNVGKSTLFNRITRSRDALVADFAGLTRDRKYGKAIFQGRELIIVDTGGIGEEGEGVEQVMAGQSQQAIAEADVVLFLLDSREGLSGADRHIADSLRKCGKPVMLVANKIDGLQPETAVAPFFELGMGGVHSISASHGRGVNALMAAAFALLPNSEEQLLKTIADNADQVVDNMNIKIAVVGRPNVGKSTLVNRLLGEERVVVYDLPGTTRDSTYINFERHDRHYTLIDTAGIRKRKNIKLAIEKFSIVKTLQAIADANVVVLLIDAQEGLVEQDLHLMGQVIDAGRALVVAINKWDNLSADQKGTVKQELDRRLRFIDFADVHFISALHGTGVGHLYDSIERAFASATEPLSTHQLTRILQAAVMEHMPPLVRGRRVKLRYAHLGGQNPPIIVIHGNQTESVPSHYTRYLEKAFRRALNLHGTPLRIELKTGDNPYAGKPNKLTPRQQAKKHRLMQHVKRQDKKRKKK